MHNLSKLASALLLGAMISLPAVAANALKPDGGVDVLRVLRGLARRPGQIRALANAGRDARAAFAALGRCGEAFAGI